MMNSRTLLATACLAIPLLLPLHARIAAPTASRTRR